MEKGGGTLELLLKNSACRVPDRMALSCGITEITYRELDRRSDEVAEILLEEIPGQNARVAFLLPKSIDSVVSVFAILKSGHAYLPLDFEAPQERNEFIIRDCGAAGLIVPEGHILSGSASQMFYKRIRLGETDLLLFAARPPLYPVRNLAYILYTSGSTGKPKGVMFTHGNALSFIDWCSSVFLPSEESVFSSHAPFHFDLSILDIYLCIKHGGKLVLIDSQTGKNPRALAHLIEEKKITHWYSTPTILKLMLNYGRIERHDHSSLQMVLFAGEVFPVEPLKKLTKAWPHARFFNLYGPTETNVCTYYEVILPVAEEQNAPFPIGRVCSHLKGILVETGENKMELCIAGPAVTQGYWNDADRNKAAFLEKEGDRWYRTGDVISENGEGEYIYMGRIDRMVKKNGFRVELGEIENVLHLQESVADAAVLAKTDENYSCTIFAFIQPKEQGITDPLTLKSFCLSILPHYMIPDHFIFLEKIPKTSTDKTDYQSLKNAGYGL